MTTPTTPTTLPLTTYLPTAGIYTDPQWLGMYAAKIANATDPTGQGRVQLLVPQVLGTGISNWATPMQPGVTGAVGSQCLALFLGGDLNTPYYFTGVSKDLIEAVAGGTTDLNTNSLFTGGSLTGWAATNGALTSAQPNSDTNPPYQYGALWTASGTGGGYITQSAAPFTATVGQAYQAQAWVYYPLGGSVNIGFGWTGQANTVTATTVPAGTWTLVSTVQDAPATSGYPIVGPAVSNAGDMFTAEAIVVTGAIPGQLITANSISAGQINFSAREIGGITTTIAATAPTGAVAGDLWFNSSANYALSQYDGTTWNLYQFGTGALEAGSITSALIAAGAVTAETIGAGAITAGTIAAGAIDGMTITGAQLIIDSASGALLIYSGTPGAGNLVGSWAGAADTDAFGNAYPAGVVINQGSIAASTVVGGGTGTGNITTLSPTQPASANAGDLWINSSNGYQLERYSGSAWVAISFGTGALAAGSVTASQIAAGAITGAEITAGSITASQLSSTAINGQTIVISSAAGQGGTVLVYSGTPTTGNLVCSMAATSGTDSHSNTYPAGFGVESGTIASSSISGGTIAGTSVTGANVTGTTITGGTVTGTTVTSGTINGSTFNGTDFIMNDNGLFLYSGSPGSGNLVGSITNGQGTDTFGNTYYSGTCTYSNGNPNIVGQLRAGAINIGPANDIGNEGTYGSPGLSNTEGISGRCAIWSGQTQPSDNQAVIELLSNSSNGDEGPNGSIHLTASNIDFPAAAIFSCGNVTLNPPMATPLGYPLNSDPYSGGTFGGGERADYINAPIACLNALISELINRGLIES